MLKIGDVAKKTGVSIRSLRHYDEIGLLKPSSHNDAGYRLYTKDDILRLQQILSLKQMGFELKKILTLLNEDALSLQKTLEMQTQFLQQQLRQQQQVYHQVKNVLDIVTAQQDVSLESIYKTMEAFKMLEKYYTQEQLEQLKTRQFSMDPKESEKYDQQWKEIFTGLAQLRQQGVAPSDEKCKAYAFKSRELLSIFTQGDAGIEQSINKMYAEEGGGQMLRNHGLDVSDELYDYYEAAIEAHVYK